MDEKNKRLFCTYQQALKLKRLGYHKSSFFFYRPESQNNEVNAITATVAHISVLDYLYDFNQKDTPYMDYGAECTAPTIDAVLRWFRFKGINAFVYFADKSKWTCEVRIINKQANRLSLIEREGFNSYGHDSYELAALAAIDHVLKRLTENKYGSIK